jgi:hypothetical protein
MATECEICGSSNVRLLIAEVAFFRGLASPVHLGEKAASRVCLGCGFWEFSVPDGPLKNLRDGVSPQSSGLFQPRRGDE